MTNDRGLVSVILHTAVSQLIFMFNLQKDLIARNKIVSINMTLRYHEC